MASASSLGRWPCTLEFSAVPSQEKKRKVAGPSPSLPLCPSFQKLFRATQQKGTGSVALPPPSPPPSSARAWRLAAAVARARGTVREVRARAAFACAGGGGWGGGRFALPMDRVPPNVSLLESRKRIRGTSRSWREGDWGGGTSAGLSARLRSTTACFFFPPCWWWPLV